MLKDRSPVVDAKKSTLMTEVVSMDGGRRAFLRGGLGRRRGSNLGHGSVKGKAETAT
jgi:hypothetical protein